MLTAIEIEPATTTTFRRRNDIGVRGSDDLGNKTTERDVKVYTVLSNKAHNLLGVMKDSELTNAPRPDAGPGKKRLVQLGSYMEELSKETKRKQPGYVGEFSLLGDYF